MWVRTLFRLVVSAISIVLVSDAWAASPSDTLIARLRIVLGQTTSANSNWTDDQLLTCINMAQDYVTGLGRAIEKTDTIAGGVFSNSEPSDFITLKDNSYLWRNGKMIRAIPRVSMDSLNKVMEYISSQSYGRDRFVIAEDGSAILVAPTTNSADSVVVSYYARAADLDTGDTCQFDPEWEQVLIMTARVCALQKIGSPHVPEAIAERDKALTAMFQSQTLRPQLGGAPVGE